MNKLTAFLIVAIIILVGALMFVVGQNNASQATNIQGQVATASLSKLRPKVVKTAAKSLPVDDIVAKAPKSDDQTVIIGGNSEFDACGSSGKVVGLDQNGDNFLAVKAAPNFKARRVDKLGPDAEVYMCDTSPDGQWTSIVYESDGQLSARCGTTAPIEQRKSYSGPCLSGWVATKYVELVAG